MSEVTGRSQSVHVEYRLRPNERMLYSLRFGRQYRVLGPIGAVLLGLGLLQSAADWTWPLLLLGVVFLLAFVWIPFSTRLRSMPITLDATNDGLGLDAGGMRGQLSWGSIRRARRIASAFVLEMEPAGTLPIPLRVFRGRELASLEGLVADAHARATTSGAPTPTAVEDPPLMTVRHEMRLRDAALALWLRPVAVVPVLVGAVLIAAGISELLGPPDDSFTTASWPLVLVGLVLLSVPIWGTAFRVYLGGGAGSMTAPYDIEIGAEGYRARLGSTDAWTSWSSFKSVRRVGRIYVFRLQGSNGEAVISARGFTPTQLETFLGLLRQRGLEGD